jgi:hypothetical protein
MIKKPRFLMRVDILGKPTNGKLATKFLREVYGMEWALTFGRGDVFIDHGV